MLVVISVFFYINLHFINNSKSLTKKENIKTESFNHIDEGNSLKNKKDLNSNSAMDGGLGSSGQTSDLYLIAPYGSFVSNHGPSKNASKSLILSQCISSPGAVCYIKFEKKDTIRSLPPQKLDSSGVTEWLWDIKKAGFSEGQWTIKATSSYKSKTITVTDKVLLDIQR